MSVEISDITTGVSKVSTKYQATIPEQVRKKANIERGDEVKFVHDGEEIRVVVVKEDNSSK